MAILISNDDGIRAPGIEALVQVLSDLDETYVVAPDRERSTTSHSLTLHRPLRIEALGERRFSVDGTPTDCVLLAVKKILPVQPWLVISGINHGANLGDDVTYSGTVAAALEGALLGIPSIAISLVSRGESVFDQASRFARSLARKVMEFGLPTGVYLNVNVPGNLLGLRGDEATLPVAVTHTGKRDFRKIIFEKTDPEGRNYYRISGDPREFLSIPGTDCEAILKQQISVTPLRVDVTHDKFFEELKLWNLQEW